ncbi:E domain-containing protein, partial [Staphylococcus hominis]|uniref:E domain-containing protein n=1 Tax=Staphylococcus hominis TaxID=1290 RepID=UPI001643CAC6
KHPLHQILHYPPQQLPQPHKHQFHPNPPKPTQQQLPPKPPIKNPHTPQLLTPPLHHLTKHPPLHPHPIIQKQHIPFHKKPQFHPHLPPPTQQLLQKPQNPQKTTTTPTTKNP